MVDQSFCLEFCVKTFLSRLLIYFTMGPVGLNTPRQRPLAVNLIHQQLVFP